MSSKESLLRLYIDSANPEDWDTFLGTGMFYGVTTNPNLLAKAGIPFQVESMKDLAQTAFDLGANEIHLQVWGEEPEEMLEIGQQLASIDSRVMVKVPIDITGILLANQLIRKGVNVTLTALHFAQQVLTAVAIGAKYAAPYLGRMNDAGMDGMREVRTMERIINQSNSSLRLLVASIRSSEDLVILASRGLNTFTLLPRIVYEIIDNDLTDKAVASFNAAIQASQGKK
jgi:transaldolase